MKKICLLLLLFPFCKLYPQEVMLTKGPEFDRKDDLFNEIIGEDNTSFYLMREGRKDGKKQYNIEKHNKTTFELEWVNDFSYQAELRSEFCRWINVLTKFSKNEISFIFTESLPTPGKLGVYMKSFDIKTGTQVRPIKLLMETAGGYLSFSKDSTLLLAKKSHIFYDPGNMIQSLVYLDITAFEKVELYDFEKGKKIFSKELPIQNGDFFIANTDVDVDNKGNLYFYCTRFLEKKNKLGHVESYQAVSCSIGKIPVNSDKSNLFELDYSIKENASLKTPLIQYSNNFDYVLITAHVVDGACKGKCDRNIANLFMKIDLTNLKLMTKKVDYFDAYAASIYADMKDYGDYYKIHMKEAIIDPVTNDVTLIASGSFYSIFVTRFDKNGNTLWTKVIPRHAPNNYTPYCYTYKNKTLYFLFLDSSKNMEDIDITNFELKKIASFGSPFGQNLICFSINKAGGLKRSIVETVNKKTPNFIPQTTENLGRKSYAYHYVNDRKEQYVLFNFK